jgi:HTH-type transcriptional regulator/antitoxin HigA
MIHPVTNHASHAKALRRIEQLWDAPPGSPEANELDALATLVDAYERRAFPIAPPDPVDAIEARREDLGWSRKELEPLLGSRARVSEVLSRRRALTLPMIRRIHAEMGISAEVLITEPRPIAKTRPRDRSSSRRPEAAAPAGTVAQPKKAHRRSEATASSRTDRRAARGRR